MLKLVQRMLGHATATVDGYLVNYDSTKVASALGMVIRSAAVWRPEIPEGESLKVAS